MLEPLYAPWIQEVMAYDWGSLVMMGSVLCGDGEHMVFRKFDWLFVCHGSRAQWASLSVQWLAHCICDAICRGYEVMDCAPPVGLRAHSTRGYASLRVLFWGVSVEDICPAASWSST